MLGVQNTNLDQAPCFRPHDRPESREYPIYSVNVDRCWPVHFITGKHTSTLSWHNAQGLSASLVSNINDWMLIMVGQANTALWNHKCKWGQLGNCLFYLFPVENPCKVGIYGDLCTVPCSCSLGNDCQEVEDNCVAGCAEPWTGAACNNNSKCMRVTYHCLNGGCWSHVGRSSAENFKRNVEGFSILKCHIGHFPYLVL